MAPLIDQFPRESWERHPNHGMLSRFWIDKHNGFRRFGAVIMDSTGLPAATEDEWLAKAQQLIGQLSHYLGHLHGHHNIEDFHYFPAFRRLEPSTGDGFDRMDEDHKNIAAESEAIARLAQSVGPTSPISDRAAMLEEIAARSVALVGAVETHLDAEEDLIIPVILKHGEWAVWI